MPPDERLERVCRFAEEELRRRVTSARLLRTYSVLERDEALYEVLTADGKRAEVILARDGTLTIFFEE